MKSHQGSVCVNLSQEDMKDEVSVDLLKALREGVKPALGCTEPVALGLAVAEAYRHIDGNLERIDIELSPNVYKNGMGVGIPGTTEKGLVFAAALAIACGDATLGLEVYRNVSEFDVAKAREIIETNDINIDVNANEGTLYIKATVKTDKSEGVCVIRDNHTNIVLVQADDKVILNKESTEDKVSKSSGNGLSDITVKDIVDFVECVPFEDVEFLLEGVKMNMEIARKGLEDASGVGLGATLNSLMEDGVMGRDMVSQARMLTSAACDARMSGVNMPVMSSAGSGNNGITAIIPIAVACEQLDCGDEKLAKALAFSHLLTAHIKSFIGVLAPICSCAIAAGIGASASITWLMGGTQKQIEGSITNIIGTLSGMICDGAKGGCAFKLSTAASEAIVQAKLAMSDVFIEQFDGILGSNADISIRNLAKICMNGMKDMDNQIIEVMTSHS